MEKEKATYSEGLLHWIWDTARFRHNGLHTLAGKAVEISNYGSLNASDGPDFLGAEITIGTLRWYGDVEIHWSVADWYAHHHQNDKNFENVILHVVFDANEEQAPVQRSNKTVIPTLSLGDYLSNPLHTFLEQYRSMPQLPCSGQFSFISEEAFNQQLKKAHKEYFEQKVDDLLAFYDPGLSPSGAWKKMFTTALFDGLGISHNRTPMQKLAQILTQHIEQAESKADFQKRAQQCSGLGQEESNTKSSMNWKHKGCRPANHPRLRIKQAAGCLWFIYSLPFEEWLRCDPKKIWAKMIQSITATQSIGRERGSILFGTVFLPALYALGDLFFSEKLKSASWMLWKTHRAAIPDSLVQLLNNTKLPADLYNHKLGTIHQLRAYCRPRNCQKCHVFRNAISS